jgi:DNA polymerase sigma
MRVPAFRDHSNNHRSGGDRGGGGGDRNTPHRSSPAPGREGRWVDVMDRSHDGRSPRCDMEKLNTSLVSLAESLMPTADERKTWQTSFEAVQKVLLAKWPEGRVMLFGSAANGLSVRSSNDIDVSFQLDAVGDDATAKSEIVEMAGQLLEDAGMTEILCLPKARVPVVKFTVPSTGTKVDITVNNTLACINTKLLADYCKVDPRLAQLVAVVKHWAKKRAVNDPYRGTLSSYCYVLMCIYHLQSRSPPVLPVLQALPPTISVKVREWKAEFFDDVEALKDFGNENKQTLGELVWQFFEYWAWRHDYMSGVISIRTGTVLPKDEKDWTRRIGNERHLLCVEDPFELSHDLGRTVDRQTRDVMRKEFLRAATLLRDAEDPLEQVFEGFKKR